ncbi:MAG TPA: nucleotidyltransferase family protein [Blastocatellia bacterium]|nr:nucleotidyltransferase family protein [Blastocatellia bacterium]
MTDIDILVPEALVIKAYEQLKALNYQSAKQFEWEQYRALRYHLPALGKAKSVAYLELHWNITPPLKPWTISVDQLWKRAQPVTLAQVATLSLCPEDVLLYICEHATYHHLLWQGVSTLCDLDRAVRHYHDTLDWQLIKRRADEWNWSKGVYLMLYLARELMQTPIRDEILAGLKPFDFDNQITQNALAHLIAEKSHQEWVTDDFAQLWDKTRLTNKARLVVKRLFPSAEEISIEYEVSRNTLTFWMYYLVRLKDLFIRWSSKVCRLWYRDKSITQVIKQNNALIKWLKQ